MHIRIDDQVTLRAFRPTDRADLVAGISDWAVARWLAQVPYPYRLDHADEYLSRDEHIDIEAAMCDPDTGFAFALCFDDRVIGGLVSKPVTEDGDREIGFWLAHAFWGQRIMRRAVGNMIEEMMKHAPDIPITASANHDNHRSQALILGLGFVEDGESEVMSTPLQRMVRLCCFRRNQSPSHGNPPINKPPIKKPPATKDRG